jgi:hypothetical protein
MTLIFHTIMLYQTCLCWDRCRASWTGFGYCLSCWWVLFFSFFFFPLVVCSGLCFMWCHWYCTLLAVWKVTLFGVDEHALHYLGTCSLCYWFVKCWSMSGRAEVLFVAFWFWFLIRLTVWIITFLVYFRHIVAAKICVWLYVFGYLLFHHFLL